MFCPSCGSEYRDGVRVCSDCGETLVPTGTPVPPAEARLGRFEAPVAQTIVSLLGGRGLRARTEPEDPWAAGQRILEVMVPADDRDELRAELVTSWPTILQRLDDDTRVAVQASGGRLPGWDDAPDGVWIDRRGQLKVSPTPEEEAAEDAGRTIGPALVVVSLLTLLFAWYAADGTPRLTAIIIGLGLLIVGAFLPR